jgi:hypothetical protein
VGTGHNTSHLFYEKKEKRLTFLLSKSKKVCSARFLPFYEFSVFYFFVIFSTSTGGLKKKTFSRHDDASRNYSKNNYDNRAHNP